MSELDNKKDVKYNLFVTSKMDNDIAIMSDMMGISKNEFVRMCLAQALLGYRTGIEVVKESLSNSTV